MEHENDNTQRSDNALSSDAQTAQEAEKSNDSAAVKAGEAEKGDNAAAVKKRRSRTALRWIIMTLGTLMMASSVYFFQTPNKFTLGGVAGIAILLADYLSLPQGILMIIINVALIIIGLILLGRQCTIRTIYCSIMYSAEVVLFEHFDLIGLITGGGTTLTNQTFLELVYAILLFGIGGAIIFNCGGSSGGTDIIALILKKFTKIDVGIALLIIDFVVICISFYAFDSIEAALYSLLGLFARTVILDGVIESIGKTKCITVITTHPEIISDYILQVIHHGYTIYDAEGGYTGEKKKVLVTVCKRAEAIKLKYKIAQADPTSFVIITDANEILGKGFGGTL